jgi:hypothetical protein
MAVDSIKNSFSNMGSTPRSSEGIYNAISQKKESLFSPSKASSLRLLSIPAVSQSRPVTVPDFPSTSSASGHATSSVWRYLIIFLILVFLSLNLILYLIKPVSAPLSEMYDPILDFSNKHFLTNFKIGSDSKLKKGPIIASVSKKNNSAAVKKLEKAIDTKSTDTKSTETADDRQKINLAPEPVKKYKKLPVIPQADDSTSRVQMKPSSKSGFCYIGEDRGFRSCIDVGAGDVCMSGNIFPTKEICINPNLRE